ncbi:MAG: hypothetical protein E6J29_05345 [Chloroflexi bacterium]|nr:MAG: hypothetical protein E6J29_05345 [Chloroflexota bacterium]
MAAAQTPERRFNVPLIVAGVVLAIAGFGASVLIGRISQAPAQAPTTATLVVAARDLDARRTIADGDLTTAHYSTADVPPNALTDAKTARGQILQVTLKKGQPVLNNMLARSESGAGAQTAFLPLPAGYVAATLPSGERDRRSGLAQQRRRQRPDRLPRPPRHQRRHRSRPDHRRPGQLLHSGQPHRRGHRVPGGVPELVPRQRHPQIHAALLERLPVRRRRHP